MAGADVVDRHLAAELLQRRDHAPRGVEVLERLALGHLEHELRQPDRRAGEDLAHLLDDRRIGEVTSGQVEAELDARAQPEHRAELVARRDHQRLGHFDDQAGGFGERNERGRRDQRAVGLAPAHQYLGSHDRAAAQVDQRLVERHELARFERALHLDDRVGAAAQRDQDRQRNDQQRQHRAAGGRDRAQVGMLGEHGGARDGRGHDQRIAGRLIVRDDRIAVRSLAFVLVERRGDQRALVQHHAHHRFARRLARQAVGQEDVRRHMPGQQQRVAGALPADAQCALSRIERQHNAEEHAVVGGGELARQRTRQRARRGRKTTRLAGLVGDQDLLQRRGGHHGTPDRIRLDVAA